MFIERRAASASVDYRLSAASTLSLGGGAGVGGLLVMNGARHEISPGWLFSGAYSHRLLDGRGAAPFLLIGLSFGGSGARTREVGLKTTMDPSPVSLYAFDIRAGVTVGKTLWNVLSPYAALRAFGGPVIWNIGGQTRPGTDKGHFQAAAGLVASLPRGVDLYAEVAPAFERAVTVGGGVGF